jgi:hypothetical protein
MTLTSTPRFDVASPAYEDGADSEFLPADLIAIPSPHGIYIKINQHYIFRDLQWAGFSFFLIYGLSRLGAVKRPSRFPM